MPGTYHLRRTWPVVSRRPDDVSKLEGGCYGIDFEWSIKTGIPTVLGISDGTRTVCVSWESGVSALRDLVCRAVDSARVSWVLHNGLQADLPVLEGQRIRIDPASVDDTILWHWLTSPNLCKTTHKSQDEESSRKGAGYLNLYAMCSLYTDAPMWKQCRGELCEGPCPDHDVFGYCGNDAYWPTVALPQMKKIAAFRGVDRLYPLHRDLSVVLSRMTEAGICIDVPYVNKLREDLQHDKEEIKAQLTFNPESPKQIMERFPSLDATTEDSVREACEDSDEPELHRLLDYKELGDGPDRWFAPREWSEKELNWKGFVDEKGYAHPRFHCFTSSGRLASAGPNFQNVAKRRLDRRTGENIGKRIRRAIIAPEGQQIVEADFKNAENRVMLWQAGYTDIPDTDFHQWMVELCGIKADDPFAMAMGSPRDAAKSVTHATNYMEGLQLKGPDETRKPRFLAEVASGARLVFPDWTFEGKIVTFTGINLARRAFGNASPESRRKALAIQTAYFKAFPRIRDLQRKITKEVERERLVKPPSGLYVPSYGYAEDRIKQAVAIFGQQPVAHLTKVALVRSTEQTDLSPRLQVHDALFFYCDLGLTGQRIRDTLRYLMVQEIPEMPRLVIPIDIKTGTDWASLKDMP